MFFKNIKINEWQQFENIDIDFSNKLTILTGANGSGKTTLLKILAKHQGWNEQSFSVPKKNVKDIIEFLNRIWKNEDKSNQSTIGNLKYSNGTNSDLIVPSTNQAQYSIRIQNGEDLKCFFIPSHRSIYKYQKMQNIPTNKKTKKMAFNEIENTIRQRFTNSHTNENNSFLMKNTLISWAIQGYGNQAMASDKELIDNYESFKEVLKKVLPSSLGFENFEIRDMEIVFICNGGNDEDHFTVIIDEIENHLHPSMQRSVLPSFLNAFPHANFIVSTHSPLIVGAVKDSVTYALKYNDDNKIESHKLDFNDQVKNATEILDEVLGVSFTMPIWVENKLEQIVETYSKKSMTEQDFSSMRNELKDIGLEKLMPQAIMKVVEGK